jgi:hypothetical protein
MGFHTDSLTLDFYDLSDKRASLVQLVIHYVRKWYGPQVGSISECSVYERTSLLQRDITNYFVKTLFSTGPQKKPPDVAYSV